MSLNDINVKATGFVAHNGDKIVASISERLAQLKAQKSPKRILMPDGMLSISDGVMQATLYRLGMDKELINEPVEKREDILNDKR